MPSFTRQLAIRNRQSGFTLIELLVVIGIIAILVSILIPVVGKVKTSAQEADTRAVISALSQAIERYHADFKAYPGPFANNQIRGIAGNTQPGQVPGPGYVASTIAFPTATPTPADQGFATSVPVDPAKITGTENLVLGLCGGLKVVPQGTGYNLQYDPTLIGKGPLSLNPANPKAYTAYIDTKNVFFRIDSGLKTGKFEDDSGAADDTVIPEFVDRFTSAGELPILYLRSRVGAKFTPTNVTDPATDENNGVINPKSTTGTLDKRFPQQQYDLDQIIAYTEVYGGKTIGQNKSIRKSDYTTAADFTPVIKHGLRDVAGPTLKSLDKNLSNGSPNPDYVYPYDAYPYFLNPAQPNTARNKDGFILISAGRDRVYGTNDDITNFGPVK